MTPALAVVGASCLASYAALLVLVAVRCLASGAVRRALNRALYCRRDDHRIGVEAETPGCVLLYCLDCPYARLYWTRPSEWCHHPINPRRRRRAA